VKSIIGPDGIGVGVGFGVEVAIGIDVGTWVAGVLLLVSTVVVVLVTALEHPVIIQKITIKADKTISFFIYYLSHFHILTYYKIK
jgi:hypothetical protein